MCHLNVSCEWFIHCMFPSLQDKSTKTDEKETPSIGQKRHKPIKFDNGDEKESPEKRARSGERNMKMYTPPSGKYSSRITNEGSRYGGNNSGRYRGGGYRRDGGFRGNSAPYRRRSYY